MAENDWWRGAIIYQIYPRSFQDSTGDGVGDLPGITRRLDHVASLGVDAIWLSPFFTSPMKDMGYDVADYRDVDPVFGTLADFDGLVARAHELGLKVIIDQVLSHTSDLHPWFKESAASPDGPKSDWYVWADGREDGTPPTNWPAMFGGPAWEWNTRRRQYYLHNFLIEQPDLNFHNPAVQDAILDDMRFWLERGVDGFRLDTVNFYHHDDDLRDQPPLPQHVRDHALVPRDMQDMIYQKTQPENLPFVERMRALTDEFDARMMVGEIGDSGDRALKVMSDYTKGESRLHMAYSFEMLSHAYSAAHFRHNIEGFFGTAHDGWPCWSLSNHDVIRHVTRWQNQAANLHDLARQSVAMLMAFEGSVGIYQGEELGQTETALDYEELTDPQGLRFWPEDKGRDGCRTPMVWEGDDPQGGFSDGTPWLPVKAPQQAHAVDRQEAANDSVLHAYRETIAFRQNSEVLRRGGTRFMDLPEPILGFHREAEGDALTCLFNLSKDPVRLRMDRAASPTGPRLAEMDGDAVTLPPSGFLYLDGVTTVAAVG